MNYIRWVAVMMIAFSILVGACGKQTGDQSNDAVPMPVGSKSTINLTDEEPETLLYDNEGKLFSYRDVPTKRIPESYEGMVRIEGGTYVYFYTNADVSREIQLLPYWIDRYEVSNADFATFVKETNYVTMAEEKGFAYVVQQDRINTLDGATWQTPEGEESSIENRMNHPVRFISYIDARRYCEYYGKRLPTKVEFEYAAGGSDNLPWSHGKQFNPNDYNYAGNSNGMTKPIDWGPANVNGLYNTSGNVWEWAQNKVTDIYPDDYLKHAPLTFALCGGSFNSAPASLKTRIRIFHNPARPYNDQGFRCAADDPKSNESK